MPCRSRVVGFYTDRRERVRPITARIRPRPGWKVQTVEVFGRRIRVLTRRSRENAEEKTEVIGFFGLGNKQVKATKTFWGDTPLPDQMFRLPVWTVDGKSFISAISDMNRKGNANFITIDEIRAGVKPYNKVATSKDLTRLVEDIKIGMKFRDENKKPELLYNLDEEKYIVILHSPPPDEKLRLEQKGSKYRYRSLIIKTRSKMFLPRRA